jgi:hypothetical protein
MGEALPVLVAAAADSLRRDRGKITRMRHDTSYPETGPETPATRFLHKHRVAHSNHLYEYEEHGGTKVSARELNVAEHAVVKTLVMEDEYGAVR